MRSATSGAIAAGASIDTWRGDRFSSGRRCERACSMWDGGGRFVGVASVIGVIGAAGRGEPAGGEARGAVRVTRRIDRRHTALDAFRQK